MNKNLFTLAALGAIFSAGVPQSAYEKSIATNPPGKRHLRNKLSKERQATIIETNRIKQLRKAQLRIMKGN